MLRFLYFAEVIAAAVLVYFMVTQILTPLILGGMLFPGLRRVELRNKLRAAEEERARKELKEYITALRRKEEQEKTNEKS